MNTIKKGTIMSGSFFGIIMGCWHGFTESFRSGLIQGILGGLFFGVFWYFLNNSKRMKKITRMEFGHDGEMIIAGGANHFSTGISVGGRLFLLKDRLEFKPHKFNFQRKEMHIALDDVNDVKYYDIWGIFQTGMKITTDNGNIEKFVVNDRDTWKIKILELKENIA